MRIPCGNNISIITLMYCDICIDNDVLTLIQIEIDAMRCVESVAIDVDAFEFLIGVEPLKLSIEFDGSKIDALRLMH